MRQVPNSNRYLLIGRGRLARHLARYFEHEKIEFIQIPGRSSPAQVGEAVADFRVTHALLAVPDQFVGEIAGWPVLVPLVKIHFSGCRSFPGVFGVHPLMTFTENESDYTRENYQRIPFAVERGAPLFSTLFPRLPNPHFSIGADEKALYHALCVVSGNFLSLLLSAVFPLWEEDLQIPRKYLEPYLEQTLKNTLQRPGQSLTGPFVREDHHAIEKHQEALGDHPLGSLYLAFKKFYQETRR